MVSKLIVKQLVEGLDKISYNTAGDAGIDLRASGIWVIDLDSEKKEITQEEYELSPGERILAKTGIQVEIPTGFWGNIRDRSGMAFKFGVHNLAGVIDETYRGEIGVVMVNLGENPYVLKKNDRIAQMVITPYEQVEIEYTNDDLSSTLRNEGGFGSSGKN
ncbi:dUTP diphosphatase [Candidatus Woesearchaeota archaeon]|nr:dUTP diphosphatase [Candidatus Woesearchaeota archaeon]